MTWIADIRFAAIARNEAKRTLICPPADVDRIRWHIEQAGLDQIVTIVASPLVPDGTAYVMDESAIEAASRESLQRSMKAGLWP